MEVESYSSQGTRHWPQLSSTAHTPYSSWPRPTISTTTRSTLVRRPKTGDSVKLCCWWQKRFLILWRWQETESSSWREGNAELVMPQKNSTIINIPSYKRNLKEKNLRFEYLSISTISILSAQLNSTLSRCASIVALSSLARRFISYALAFPHFFWKG